jgi:hypothetical protein
MILEELMDRFIHSEWSDDEYICELSDAHYRIYDLLLKNTSRIGISKVNASQMCWRANKMERATYTSIISQLTADGKIATHNGYLAILNHHKYWDYTKPNTAKGAVYDILEIIDDVLDCEPVMIAISNVLIRLLKQNKTNKTFNDLYTMVIDKVYNNYSIPLLYADKPILYADKPIKDIDSDRDSDIDIEKDIDNKKINPPISPQTVKIVQGTFKSNVVDAYLEKNGYSNWSTNDYPLNIRDAEHAEMVAEFGIDGVDYAIQEACRKQFDTGKSLAKPAAYIRKICKNRSK